MKKSLLLTYFLTFLPCFGFGQKIDTIYYDKHWNPVTSKKYKYYRIARQDSNCVRVFDYFKSGKIQMSGGYKSFDLIEQTGPFYYYKRNRIYNLDVYELSKYPDILAKYKGVLDNFPMQPDSLVLSIFFFNNNKVKSLYFRHKCCTLDGPRLDFLKNGDLMTLTMYSNDQRNGTYYWYIGDKIYISGFFKNNLRDGEWKHYDLNGNLKRTDYYNEGKKIH